MGIIRSLILLFYVPAVLAAVAVCAGVCLDFIPQDVWQKELNYIISRQETLAVLGGMGLASLILLTGLFKRKSDNSMSLLSDDVHLEINRPGEVKVTVPAIVGVVERAAVTISGVRSAEASVYRQDGAIPIKVKLVIVMSQNFSAPKVSENVIAAVNDALSTALELENVPVEIKVNEITHAIIERDKRVV